MTDKQEGTHNHDMISHDIINICVLCFTSGISPYTLFLWKAIRQIKTRAESFMTTQVTNSRLAVCNGCVIGKI